MGKKDEGSISIYVILGSTIINHKTQPDAQLNNFSRSYHTMPSNQSPSGQLSYLSPLPLQTSFQLQPTASLVITYTKRLLSSLRYIPISPSLLPSSSTSTHSLKLSTPYAFFSFLPYLKEP